MCVIKIHAFTSIGRPPSWSGTTIFSTLSCLCKPIMLHRVSSLAPILFFSEALGSSNFIDICIVRGQYLQHDSVILIPPDYVFALSHNACTLLRSVIASIIYQSGHISAVIASCSYCSKLILSTLLLLFFIAYLFIYYLSACQLIQFLRFNIKNQYIHFKKYVNKNA